MPIEQQMAKGEIEEEPTEGRSYQGVMYLERKVNMHIMKKFRPTKEFKMKSKVSVLPGDAQSWSAEIITIKSFLYFFSKCY